MKTALDKLAIKLDELVLRKASIDEAEAMALKCASEAGLSVSRSNEGGLVVHGDTPYLSIEVFTLSLNPPFLAYYEY